jgi:hypothetical protein
VKYSERQVLIKMDLGNVSAWMGVHLQDYLNNELSTERVCGYPRADLQRHLTTALEGLAPANGKCVRLDEHTYETEQEGNRLEVATGFGGGKNTGGKTRPQGREEWPHERVGRKRSHREEREEDEADLRARYEQEMKTTLHTWAGFESDATPVERYLPADEVAGGNWEYVMRLPAEERGRYLHHNMKELEHYETRWGSLVEGRLRETLEHLGLPILQSWIMEMDLWQYKVFLRITKPASSQSVGHEMFRYVCKTWLSIGRKEECGRKRDRQDTHMGAGSSGEKGGERTTPVPDSNETWLQLTELVL